MNKIALAILVLLGLSGCGGGGDVGSPTPSPITSPKEITGGSLSKPSVMDANSFHLISGDDANNYFKIEGKVGQTIVIYAELDTYLDDQSSARCSASPTGYYVEISLVGTDVQSCSTNFETTFDSSGTKVFRFGFPYNNFGFFNYAIIGDNDDSEPLPANGSGGLPDKPRLIVKWQTKPEHSFRWYYSPKKEVFNEKATSYV